MEQTLIMDMLRETYLGADVIWSDKNFLSIEFSFPIVYRKERHVTFHFLGNQSKESIQEIGRQLLEKEIFSTLPLFFVDGLGGAVEEMDGSIKLLSDFSELYGKSKMVLWAAIRRTREIEEWHKKLISIIQSPIQDIEFWPHITLGSWNPFEKDGYWDVFTIQKSASIHKFPNRLNVNINKIHISSKEHQPESLFLIRDFGANLKYAPNSKPAG
jgi:2'-5' RNA ligase